MGRKGAGSTDRQLWERWRALADGGQHPAEPDALSLAAYADGRLSESEAEAVEAWLAAAPERFDDVIAAREQRLPQVVYHHVVAGACALVADASAPGAGVRPGAEILPFRRLVPQLRTALAWSSVAASLVCASLVGFSMGSDAYVSLSGTQSIDATTSDALVSPPSLDSYFSDDSGT